jgi:hypothetical protein
LAGTRLGARARRADESRLAPPGAAAYLVLVVVALLAAVAAVSGASLPSPLASTALQAAGN